MFENQLGESITVGITSAVEDTAALLKMVLLEDEEAAERLAVEVHSEISISEVNTSPVPHFEIDASSLGIWIDPIGTRKTPK